MTWAKQLSGRVTTIPAAKVQREVFILRGLPGSGKSYIARILAMSVDRAESSVICSNDLFHTRSDGTYCWSEKTHPLAIRSCWEEFESAVRSGINRIIVDNVNYKRSHFSEYALLAKEYGYSVTEVTVGNLDTDESFRRNSHGVPLATIQRMASGWEQ